MDAFHAFLAAQQQPRAAKPSTAPKPSSAAPPSTPEPAHKALFRLWHAEWQAERRAAQAAAAARAANPSSDPEFAALVTRLNLMAQRLQTPPEVLPPPDPAWQGPVAAIPFGPPTPPRRPAPHENPNLAKAWILPPEQRPIPTPERVPKITVKGRGRGGKARVRKR